MALDQDKLQQFVQKALGDIGGAVTAASHRPRNHASSSRSSTCRGSSRR